MTITKLTTTPMTLTQVAKTYGNPRDSIKVGDKVLCECSSTSQGSYLILANVIELSETTAKLRSIEAYFFSGQVSPEAKEIEVLRNVFQESISARLQKSSEFFRWLVAELRI